MSKTTTTTTSMTTAHKDMSEYLLKVVIVGNTGAGKTSLLLRYTDHCFSESFIATIGVDFKIKSLDMGDCTAKLQLWDTAGQDRFKSIVSSFYRHADGLVLVFDVTDMESFQSINGWLSEARQYGSDDCLTLLVGNKSDLTDKRVVDFNTAQALADSLGLWYIETSAKNAKNVHQAFASMAESLVARKKEERPASLKEDIGSENQRVKINSKQVHYFGCFGDEACRVI